MVATLPIPNSGVELRTIPLDLTVSTAASIEGWGGYLHGNLQSKLLVQGQWILEERSLHINLLELRAVRLTFLQLEQQLIGKKVLLESDNTTTVAYLNKQGGVHSPSLNQQLVNGERHLGARSSSLRNRQRPDGLSQSKPSRLQRMDSLLSCG